MGDNPAVGLGDSNQALCFGSSDGLRDNRTSLFYILIWLKHMKSEKPYAPCIKINEE